MNPDPYSRPRKASLFIIAFWLALLIVPLRGRPSSAAGKNILTTILPLYLFTGNLVNGIENIHLELLIDGENANPHTYSMTIEAMKRISKAHVIIANGKAEEILDFEKIRSMNPSAKILLTHSASASAEDLPTIDGKNPHTWLSPKRAIVECEEIVKTLVTAFPDLKESIEGNMRGYRKKLEVLAGQLALKLSRVKSAEIITFHDALDVFAADFGVPILYHIEDVHGIPPSPGKLVKILEAIRVRNNRVVLVSETPEPDPITSMIAKKSNATTVWFDPIISGKRNLARYEETMMENVEKLVSSFTM